MEVLNARDGPMSEGEEGETIDYAGYEAPYLRDGDDLVVTVNDDPATLHYGDNLSFEVYENYAAFNYEQRDITAECSYDAETGTVRLPAVSFTSRNQSLKLVLLGLLFSHTWEALKSTPKP